MRARCLVVAAILGTGLAGRAAQAQSRRPDRIFLRFLVGPAGVTGTSSRQSLQYAYQGGGIGLGFAVGSALSRSVVLYGQVFQDYAQGSLVMSNGHDAFPAGGINARFDGVGPGVAYYFPSDLYLGASLLFTELSFPSGGGSGLGASVIVGKEFRVSDSWGLGLAAQAFVGSNSTPDGLLWWAGGGAMLAFSASYN